MTEIDLNGRVALITGAARGIGLETARELHARGAHVALVDLDRKATEAAAHAIGEHAHAYSADVTDEDAVALVVDAVATELGGIDVVVANAGIAQPVRPNTAVDRKDFDRVLAVNLHGVVHTVRNSLPHVIDRQGHVLVIASVYAFMNGSLQTSYAMSKAAVEQYGRALRVELRAHGASAGVGYFGFVDTVMVRDAKADPIAELLDGRAPAPLRKQIPPAEAAAALVRGIETRAARTIRPRRWSVLFRLRGILGPVIDERISRDREVLGAITAAEGRASS